MRYYTPNKIASQKILVVQHIECEDLGSFAEHFARSGIEYDYVTADNSENFPNIIKGYNALILLGGPISAYNSHAFLKKEETLIDDAITKNIPILGICLGSQILAKVLGARVYKGKQKEIGWYKIKFTNTLADKVMYDFGSEATVFQWHGDTFNLPSNCKRLASSQLFTNQAFRFGDNIYALQFHLEVTETMIKEWIKEYDSELHRLTGIINPAAILKESPKNMEDLSKLSEKFCSRFARLIQPQ